jgi:hypothetical protein
MATTQQSTLADFKTKEVDEQHRRQMEQYEALLRKRFQERYPNPGPEEQRKIQARVQTLVERFETSATPPAAPQISSERFEQQLRERLAARYPNLSPDQSRRLQERIGQAVQRYQTARPGTGPINRSIDETRRLEASRKRESHEPGVYER